MNPNPDMNAPPPVIRANANKDSEHLNLLSIFHFVGAGLAMLGILFLIGHFALFHAFFANPKMWEGQKGGPPPKVFFDIFKWFYLFFGVWLLASGSLNVISGICIRARTNRTLSLIVAGINCLHLPLGTVLGVFTIVVLSRQSVRELYGT